MTDGEPETAVSASLQKIKSIKNQHFFFFFFFFFFFVIFYFIKSQTSDSFVNHFEGHFAYLKALDFSFKQDWHAALLTRFFISIPILCVADVKVWMAQNKLQPNNEKTEALLLPISVVIGESEIQSQSQSGI